MGRPDSVVASNKDGSKFLPHPEGQFVGQCVDVIDLGERVEDFAGKPKKLTPKCALVFRTGEVNEHTGEPIDISREFTVSMGELANLRKFLESWRGKGYDADQLDDGVPLDKLCGNHGLLTVEQRAASSGRKYGNIQAIVPVPKQMRGTLPDYTAAYTRAEYWAERKKEYADAARKYRAEIGAPPSEADDVGDAMAADDDDDLDALPF